MACFGRTYVVNEDNGFYNGKKVKRYRDSSFRSMITFMLLLLVFWMLVSSAIWAIQSSKDEKSKSHSNSSKEEQELLQDNIEKFTEKIVSSSTNKIPITDKLEKETVYTDEKNNSKQITKVYPNSNNTTSTKNPNIKSTIQDRTIQQMFTTKSSDLSTHNLIWTSSSNSEQIKTKTTVSNIKEVTSQYSTDYNIGEPETVTKKSSNLSENLGISTTTENTVKTSPKSATKEYLVRSSSDFPIDKTEFFEVTSPKNYFENKLSTSFGSPEIENETDMTSQNYVQSSTDTSQNTYTQQEKLQTTDNVIENDYIQYYSENIIRSKSTESLWKISTTEENIAQENIQYRTTNLIQILTESTIRDQDIKYIEKYTESTDGESQTTTERLKNISKNITGNTSTENKYTVPITTEQSDLKGNTKFVVENSTHQGNFVSSNTDSTTERGESIKELTGYTEKNISDFNLEDPTTTQNTIKYQTENNLDRFDESLENISITTMSSARNLTSRDFFIEKTTQSILGNKPENLESTTEETNFEDGFKTTSNSLLNILVSETTIQFKSDTNNNKQGITTSQEAKTSAKTTSKPLVILKEPTVQNVTEKIKLCETAVCKGRASQILEHIDYSTDPCDNFYEFSCGRHPKSKSDKITKILLEAYYKEQIPKGGNMKMFRNFFETCVDYERNTCLMEKNKNVRNMNIRKDDLTILLKFLLLRQSTPLFDIKFGPINNQKKYGIQILPPSTSYQNVGLKKWSLKRHIEEICYAADPSLNYKKEINLPKVYKSFKTCQKDMFKKITENFFSSDNTSVGEQNNFINFFAQITSAVSNFNYQHEILNKNYVQTTIAELRNKYGDVVNWKDLFKNITYGEFDESTTIYIFMEKNYFHPLINHLKIAVKANETKILNHIVTYFQMELEKFLLKDLDDKDEYCMDQATELMPELANQIFIQYTHLKSSDSDIINTAFNDTKDQFYWLIDQSQLEEANKIVIKNRLDSLKLAHFLDAKDTQQFSDSLLENVYVSKDHLSNIFMLVENRRKYSYSLRNPMNTFYLHNLMDKPFEKYPKYISYKDTIVIPNAFVYEVSKMKDNKEPEYILQTYMKFYLSIEIALFLDEVHENLKSSFYSNFIKNINIYLYPDDTIQFNNQLISFKLPEDSKWDSVKALSNRNRISDNLALKVAFAESFSENINSTGVLPWISNDFSAEEQFFIIIAQEYCQKENIIELAQSLYENPQMPPLFRLYSLLTNSDDFHSQFECKPGTKMNPGNIITQFDSFTYEYEYTN
ncbi:uncharacterized protein LOC115875453 [Sitophilus oryzae]|uniref:Uncharacterized protein LOC115875453 n=1 Tax=Sitophilus oryzae TaxID=7048 RepID=A0A6J2X6H8_SITOR|nr:uncharacterized protein LOC115875453 [Sitophilus oryzae]